eukprot:scaffold36244_cov18-Tisochrysis_lutea.AAC.1
MLSYLNFLLPANCNHHHRAWCIPAKRGGDAALLSVTHTALNHYGCDSKPEVCHDFSRYGPHHAALSTLSKHSAYTSLVCLSSHPSCFATASSLCASFVTFHSCCSHDHDMRSIESSLSSACASSGCIISQGKSLGDAAYQPGWPIPYILA